jgi:hypothetical protein
MRRGHLVGLLVAAVVVLIALAVTYSYLHTSGALSEVTVTGGTVHLEQGDAHGIPWLGASWHNFSGEDAGYPVTLTAGATFTVEVPLDNADSSAHTVNTVLVAAPFALASTSVPIPVTVGGDQDTSLLLTLNAPASSGTYAFVVTIACFS